MKKEPSEPLPPDQRAEIEALAVLPEDQIKTGDIPEQRDWSGARRGRFCRPTMTDASGPAYASPGDSPSDES